MKDLLGVLLIIVAILVICDKPNAQVMMDSGQTLSGAIDPPGDQDDYIFTGSAGDTIILDVVAPGTPVEPSIVLYDPDGVLETSVCAGTNIHRTSLSNYKLLMSGTYTAVIKDCDYDADAGAYNLSFIKVPGPLTSTEDPDGGSLVSGETKSGSIDVPGDLDGYAFTASAGDTIILDVVAPGTPVEPSIVLYDPDGVLETWVCAGTNIHRTSLSNYKLLMSGTYTAVIGDCDYDADAGAYNLSFIKVPGPLTSTEDPDGGSLVSGETKSGSIDVPGDLDGFRFAGCSDNTIVLNVAAPSTRVEPGISLYDPDGVLETWVCAGTNIHQVSLQDYKLLMSGTYTAVIGDCDYDADAGAYNLSFIKIPSSPTCCDMDADGYDSPACPSGSDCNDSNPHIYPSNVNTNCDCKEPNPEGSTEIECNEIDEDCNGSDFCGGSCSAGPGALAE